MALKKIFLIMTVVTICLVTIKASAKEKYPKCLTSSLIRKDGTIIQTFDKVSFSILRLDEINRKKHQLKKEDATTINVYPNPILSESTIIFELTDESEVELFYYSVKKRKITIYEGKLNKGLHKYNVSTKTLVKGLNIIYLDVNGKINIFKTISL